MKEGGLKGVWGFLGCLELIYFHCGLFLCLFFINEVSELNTGHVIKLKSNTDLQYPWKVRHAYDKKNKAK